MHMKSPGDLGAHTEKPACHDGDMRHLSEGWLTCLLFPSSGLKVCLGPSSRQPLPLLWACSWARFSEVRRHLENSKATHERGNIIVG